MKVNPVDTNVIIRYLVETPETIPQKFKGVFSFFKKIESGSIKVQLTELVLFESFFVLTRIYETPIDEASDVLLKLISLEGIRLENRKTMVSCFKLLLNNKIDLVDAYLIALAKEKGLDGVYSFDKDISKSGLSLLKVE